VINVRTALKNYDGLIYIPDLRAHMVIEVKQTKTSKDFEVGRINSTTAPGSKSHMDFSETNLFR